MSDYESKFAVRGHVPELDGKSRTEAYEYFSKILGEAEDVDVYNEKVEFFQYDKDEHDFTVAEDNKKWALEKDIASGYSEEVGVINMDLEDIEAIKQEMLKVIPTIDYFIIASYTWYNGVDEPVCLDRPERIYL